MAVQKLCLGTVQFGFDYGISNRDGKVSSDEVKRILRCAFDNRIGWLDTACNYGDSEKIVGGHIQDDMDFKISSKSMSFPTIPPDFDEFVGQYERYIENSFSDLGCDNLEVYDFRDLGKVLNAYGDHVVEWITSLKKQGKIKKIGASIYSEEEINEILSFMNVDVIQAPVSVLDQRLVERGALKKLKDRNIEVHVRSIFLQGLIFMNPQNLPTFFEPIATQLQNTHSLLEAHNLSPLEASLNFVLSCPDIDKVIVGVTNERELLEIINITKAPLREDVDWQNFKLNDAYYLNPVNWN